ncbi:hypothetical protein F5Y19DRAFT_450551 [Xylariaceae sp. FL1651]|nr:hypothetical protein F5Y19DRAFT_450551 [Xylariaceae sp. FL1651]
MMPSVFGANIPQITPPTYINDPISDEFSRELAFLDSNRRLSRPPNGQRTSSAMRVVKPSSANNSPQSMMARRRTLMNDSNLARRRQQALDQAVLQQMQDTTLCYTNHPDPVKRSNRPVSWHPSSHLSEAQQMSMQMPQVDFTQYAMHMPTSCYTKDGLSGYQALPPTPAAYSGHTSPVSSYSPLLLPYSTAAQSTAMPAYVSTDPWIPTPQVPSNYFNTNGSLDAIDPFSTYTTQTSFNWNTHAPQRLDSCTAPPTPEEFQAVQQSESMPPEESIPYQPLADPDEEEEEGEILIGMGLYDPPSKTESDPELDNYRKTTSQFLGITYRSGKGWKLEEAWEPPTTDDEDGDEDAESDEQEERDTTTESPPAQQPWI